MIIIEKNLEVKNVLYGGVRCRQQCGGGETQVCEGGGGGGG